MDHTANIGYKTCTPLAHFLYAQVLESTWVAQVLGEYLGLLSSVSTAYMYMPIDVHVRTMYAWGVASLFGRGRGRAHSRASSPLVLR